MVTIATGPTNCTDWDKMNPNNDRNDHTSVNPRKTNDEYDYSHRSHPPKEEWYLQRLVRPTAPSFRQIYAVTENTMETTKHKTVNRTTTNNNEVLTVTWKLNQNHAPLHTLNSSTKEQTDHFILGIEVGISTHQKGHLEH